MHKILPKSMHTKRVALSVALQRYKAV